MLCTNQASHNKKNYATISYGKPKEILKKLLRRSIGIEQIAALEIAHRFRPRSSVRVTTRKLKIVESLSDWTWYNGYGVEETPTTGC